MSMMKAVFEEIEKIKWAWSKKLGRHQDKKMLAHLNEYHWRHELDEHEDRGGEAWLTTPGSRLQRD